ncbi:TPA: tail fiber protein, partial [Neisseria lactamica]
MANLNETAQWETGIYQLETSDPVMGGPDGIDNRQAKQLANRTLWLKNQTEALQTESEGKAASSTTVTAGNGLTGGGNLTASRTISLGQPGQITAQSQNAVQSSGHTHAIDTATTSRAGIVQLESSTGSQAEDRAATPKAVKAAYDKAIEAINAARGINIPSVGTASTSRAGIVMLDNSTDSQLEDRAATPKAVKAAYDKAVEAANAVRAFSIPTASTSRAGIVQLSDRISNTTADAGKAPTTAAVNRAIDELGENVLGRITQANTRINNAVTLTGDQTITGAKIFQADIKVSASAAHAAADRYIRLGADATGSYAVNPKSSKVLYLKHDGSLTYDGHNVLLARDISSAVNLDDANKVASAAAVKTAYDAATAASAAVQNMALTGNAAENGWLKLPNGILMQWGKATIEGVHRQKEIFFPVAFR